MTEHLSSAASPSRGVFSPAQSVGRQNPEASIPDTAGNCQGHARCFANAAVASELLPIVHKLYSDGATPHAALVQWRLLGVTREKIPGVVMKATVEATPELFVSNDEGRKGMSWVALLVAEPSYFRGFQDGLNPESGEPIPQEAITQAACHLLVGGWHRPDDARHDKYAIGDWLQESLLGGVKYGVVMRILRHFLCNSVQVLGKRQGRIVPYTESEEFEKRNNAWTLMPTGLRNGEAFVSTWKELREHLLRLLHGSDGHIRVSSLKQDFRSIFELELTETALGHTSMSSLLTDPHLADIITFDLAAPSEIYLRSAEQGSTPRAAPIQESSCEPTQQKGSPIRKAGDLQYKFTPPRERHRRKASQDSPLKVTPPSESRRGHPSGHSWRRKCPSQESERTEDEESAKVLSLERMLEPKGPPSPAFMMQPADTTQSDGVTTPRLTGDNMPASSSGCVTPPPTGCVTPPPTKGFAWRVQFKNSSGGNARRRPARIANKHILSLEHFLPSAEEAQSSPGVAYISLGKLNIAGDIESSTEGDPEGDSAGDIVSKTAPGKPDETNLPVVPRLPQPSIGTQEDWTEMVKRHRSIICASIQYDPEQDPTAKLVLDSELQSCSGDLVPAEVCCHPWSSECVGQDSIGTEIETGAGDASLGEALLPPYGLPSWCTVRRTFVEACSPEPSAASTRCSSAPPTPERKH